MIREEVPRCTMCGKKFTEADLSFRGNRHDIFVGYHSRYDLKRLQLNLCVDCFDRVLDMLIPMCRLDPVTDDDWVEHCTSMNRLHRNWGPGGGGYRKDVNERIIVTGSTDLDDKEEG